MLGHDTAGIVLAVGWFSLFATTAVSTIRFSPVGAIEGIVWVSVWHYGAEVARIYESFGI